MHDIMTSICSLQMGCKLCLAVCICMYVCIHTNAHHLSTFRDGLLVLHQSVHYCTVMDQRCEQQRALCSSALSGGAEVSQSGSPRSICRGK